MLSRIGSLCCNIVAAKKMQPSLTACTGENQDKPCIPENPPILHFRKKEEANHQSSSSLPTMPFLRASSTLSMMALE